jgi:HTH-type transcriptional regulator/antitoxin HigA
MNNSVTFEPDWVSPPGATVLEIMKERHLSIKDFATATRSTPPVIARLLNGIEPLTDVWAAQLAHTLGASPDFWLRREDQYRNGFDRLCPKNLDANAWLDELPVNDMVHFGWIKKGQSKADTLLSALTFFGVTSIESWKLRYAKAADESNYRTSTAFEIKQGAVAAWIRQGEIRAHEIDCDILLEIRIQHCFCQN